jgi:hypothetical protein
MPKQRKPPSKPPDRTAQNAARRRRTQIAATMPPPTPPLPLHAAEAAADRTAKEIAAGISRPVAPLGDAIPPAPVAVSTAWLDLIGTPDGPLTLRALSDGNQGHTVVTTMVNPEEPKAGLFGTAGVQARATVQTQMRAQLTVTPGDWAAERDQALRRVNEILPILERILPVAAEAETAYRERLGMGGNYPPEPIGPSLDVATVRLAIDAANVYRTELSSAQPRFEVIRVCAGALKLATKAIIGGLKVLACGLLAGTGKHIADEAWPILEPAVHDLVGQTEIWLRTLGLL